MPAEFILVLMLVVPIAVTYMDVWGDVREDPRGSGQARPAQSAEATPTRLAAEQAEDFALGAKLSGSATIKRRKLAAGPRLVLRELPVPGAADLPAWHWLDLACGAHICDPFGASASERAMGAGDRHSAVVARMSGGLLARDMSFMEWA